MKKIKYLISILFIAVVFGCSDEDGDISFADDAAAPSNITALFTIAQDNSGTVTIAPHGEGVTSFEIQYGDGTTEPAVAEAGGKVSHVFPEGTFTVKVTGIGINGKRTEADFPLTVSFVAPENLVVSITNVVGNPLKIEVNATADLETFFKVWFGEDPSAEPVEFNEGDTVSHTYSAIGTYTVTVIAYSGGAASTTFTQQVIISNPLNLPIDFESTSLNYAFTTFGGAVASVTDNPVAGGINNSNRVGSMTPAAGQTWTGGYLTLDAPINLDQNFFRIKVWSPQTGVTVKLKLENLTDGNESHEEDAITTVQNGWEELVYDFSSATGSYSKVVLFFNAGNPGTGDTYYFDDISQSNTGVAIAMPLTFENSAIDYTFTDFQGAVSQKIANPHVDTNNPSANVMRVMKPTGGQAWAGSHILLTNPVDFSTQGKIKMKVWSPAVNTPVIFKFEKGNDGGVNVERNVRTTVANQWEEMTFDFTGTNNANNYQRIVVFFNAGIAGTNDTYYFDDIKQSN